MYCFFAKIEQTSVSSRIRLLSMHDFIFKYFQIVFYKIYKQFISFQ